MKILFSSIFLLFFINQAQCQLVTDAIRFNGKVVINENCQPIGGCEIWIEGTSYRSFTDIAGIFIFDYPIQTAKDSIILLVNYFGFEEQKIKLQAKKSGQYQLNIGLYPKAKELNEIVVSNKANIKSSKLKKQIEEIILKGKVLTALNCTPSQDFKLFFAYRNDSLKQLISVNELGEFSLPILSDATQFNLGEIILESANYPKQLIQITQLNYNNLIILENDFSFKNKEYSYDEEDVENECYFPSWIGDTAAFLGGMNRFYTLTQKNLSIALKKRNTKDSFDCL